MEYPDMTTAFEATYNQHRTNAPTLMFWLGLEGVPTAPAHPEREPIVCPTGWFTPEDTRAYYVQAATTAHSGHLETAACLWEAVCTGDELTAATRAHFDAYKDEVGTPALRHAVIGLVAGCEAVWEDMRARQVEEQYVPYDWEFCPAYLNAAVEQGVI